MVIPILTFTFAILYAVSTLVAVFTRSPIAAMLALGRIHAVFLYIVGKVKQWVDSAPQRGRSERHARAGSFTLVDTLNNILPRYKDLDKLTSKLIAEAP